MSYQDPPRMVSWVEFEESAKSTIMSAQVVIQQLGAVLIAGEYFFVHNDDSSKEAEANIKLDMNCLNKAVGNTANINLSVLDDMSHKEENIAENYSKYQESNVKQEYFLDTSGERSPNTQKNGKGVTMNQSSFGNVSNHKEKEIRFFKSYEIPTEEGEKMDVTKHSYANNDTGNEVDTSSLRIIVSNDIKERSLDYSLLSLKVKSKENSICQICGKIVKIKHGLKNHMQKHSDFKEFVCSQCPKQFKSRFAFKSHLKYHEGIYDIKCLQCDKTFVSSAFLNGHMLYKHNNGDSYPCDKCEKIFKVKGQLTRHMPIHTGETPFKCREEGCGKAFRIWNSRKDHERQHRGVKEFQCTYCDSKFMQATQLRRHILYHKGIKKHSCTVCSKKFVEVAQARKCKHSTIVNTKSKLNK